MGWGDYIMASGHVRRIKKSNPNIQVLINNPFNKTQFYNNIFLNNPYITHEEFYNKDKAHIKINRAESGVIDKHLNKIIWKDERVSEVGDLYSTTSEINFANKFIKEARENWISKNKKQPKATIYISDTSKATSSSKEKFKNKNDDYLHSVNKEWGKDKWQEFINSIKNDYLILKSSHTDSEFPNNVYSAVCNFRTVKALMDKSDFFIGNEGGLSHLWATTRKKGIVFFGHWIPPYLTGYPFHINITTNHNNHCGSLSVCPECLDFYKNLSPELIKSNLESNI